jgi:hypothetical protein
MKVADNWSMEWVFAIGSVVLLAWAMLTILGGEKKRLEYQKMIEEHAMQEANASPREIWLK